MTDNQIATAAQHVLAALIAPVLWATLIVTGHAPAPSWSPMAQPIPSSSTLFNPGATLDTSRMGDR